MQIRGTLTFAGGASTTSFASAAAQQLTAWGLNVSSASNPLTFNNVRLSFVDGVAGSFTFDKASFTGFPLTYSGSMFTMNRTAGASYTFSNLSFAGTLSPGVGRYITNSGSTTISLVSVNPAAGVVSSLCGCTGGTQYIGTVTWP